MVLVDIEGVEQFLDVPSFGGHYLSGQCVPDDRNLLKKFHKILELNISSSFGKDEPSESRLLQIIPSEYDPKVMQVIIFGDVSIIVMIDEVEYATDE